MKRLEQGVRFASLEELEATLGRLEPGEEIEMDRLQYSDYKVLVWKWLQRLNPISLFRGDHLIVIIKRSDE